MADKKILIAEDSSVLQNLIKKILIQDGNYDIQAVKNGKAVLDKLAKDKFDLLLLDINMPQLNGVECAKQIRAGESENVQIPIVAITGNAMNMSDEDFKAVGINEFVPKPIDFDKLVGVVRSFLVD